MVRTSCALRVFAHTLRAAHRGMRAVLPRYALLRAALRKHRARRCAAARRFAARRRAPTLTFFAGLLILCC